MTVGLSPSSDVEVAAGPRRWVQAIKAIVPIAFVAAIVAHALPFFYLNPGGFLFSGVQSGFSTFFIGFFVLTVAPLDPYFEAFSFPLISAVVGLILLRRRGRFGSVGPLVCALVGSVALGSAYLLDPQGHWAYGYFAAEGCFLVATAASAVRLVRLRRDPAMWDAKAEPRFEPAASGQQELLARYRKNW
jgi:hypothetical protein